MDLNDISTNITFPSQSVYQFDAKKKKKKKEMHIGQVKMIYFLKQAKQGELYIKDDQKSEVNFLKYG